MRARVFLSMFLFAVSLPAFGGEEKKEDAIKEDAIKVDLSYLEKTWGIKCKSHRVTGNPNKEVIFLLEFTKDVENLNELRKAIAVAAPNVPTWPLWFYFFDEENVFVYKSPPNVIEGEVTGKKGDAIRVSVSMIGPAHLKKTRKIEARPGEKGKDKEKK